jgi:protoporphyrinogen oxidase
VLESSGVQFSRFERKSSVVLDGVIVPYPLQFNLWACEAADSAAIRDELEGLVGDTEVGDSLETDLLNTWGGTLTQKFFRPYLEKMWGRSLTGSPPSWGSRFVPAKDMEQVYKGFEGPVTGYGYNSSFLYPSSGRIGDLPEAIAADINESLVFDAEIVAIDPIGKVVRLSNGQSFGYSKLISTIPLNSLLKMMGRRSPSSYLSYSNLLNVRVGFHGQLFCDEHWLYLPDSSVTAFRVGFPSNFSKSVCPKGSYSLSLEVGLGEGSTAPMPTEEIAQEALNYLADKGLLQWDSIDLVDSHLISPAYVAHRMSVTPCLQELANQLELENIYLAGRYGAWDYISLEDAYLSGMDTAASVLQDDELGSVRKVG